MTNNPPQVAWRRQEKGNVSAVLIQPPLEGEVSLLLPHMGEDGIGFKPPIGLLYIATYLKERTSHSISVIDAQAERLSILQCVEKTISLQPDVVGISAWTDWWYAACKLGKLIKEALPNVHICYGGPHVSIFHDETLSARHTDSVVLGDGEIPFARLCDRISENRSVTETPGLHFKTNGVRGGEDLFYIHKNLDELPIPDRTILPLDNYSSVIGKSDTVTTMITSRGCPFSCVFCKLNFQKTLCRSAENVVEEFREIEKLGIKEIEVYDDTFTWSRSRVISICKQLVEEGVRVRWAIRDRVSAVDADLLDAMKKAGCYRIHYGVESGSDRIIDLMKKNITVEQARNAIRMAKKRKFVVLAYFMFGNMGETTEDIKTTIDFALELDADYAEFSITIPYPGTHLYEKALETGIISHDYWKEFALNPEPDFQPPELYEENVKLDDLIRFRNEAIQRYYFRPGYLVKELLASSSLKEIAKKAKMGARLFRNSMAGGGQQNNG